MIGETKIEASSQTAMNRSAPASRNGSRTASALKTARNGSSENRTSLRRGPAMASMRPLTAAAPLARSGEREPVSVEEVVVGVEGLRLIHEFLLVGRQSRSRELLQDFVRLRPVVHQLAPNRATPDNVVSRNFAGGNDAVLFEVLDDCVPDVGVVGRACLVIVILFVVVERCERMQDRNRVRDALAI